jgi:hypothetical protein
MEDKTQALLEGQFFLYPLRLTNYQVKLTRQGITFYELPKRKDKLLLVNKNELTMTIDRNIS